VSLSPFKAYVEEMIKRLREALGASLRKKVRLVPVRCMYAQPVMSVYVTVGVLITWRREALGASLRKKVRLANHKCVHLLCSGSLGCLAPNERVMVPKRAKLPM
jgi:hypothetical protein